LRGAARTKMGRGAGGKSAQEEEILLLRFGGRPDGWRLQGPAFELQDRGSEWCFCLTPLQCGNGGYLQEERGGGAQRRANEKRGRGKKKRQ